MRLYLTAQSSLVLIRHLRSIKGAEGIEGAILVQTSDERRHEHREGRRPRRDRSIPSWSHSHPIHALVRNHNMKAYAKTRKQTCFPGQIPSGRFLDLGHGLCICTPQLAFLQLSTQIDPIELLKVGTELCGCCSRPPIPRTRVSKHADEGLSCTYNLPPVADARPLRLLERMEGQRGALKARNAVRAPRPALRPEHSLRGNKGSR
jgi:hypothetical protein